jgi:1-pyrroline-4-hydroxy-2-carboxylate deaminase
MDRSSVDWRGYMPACPTPFTADTKHIDVDALSALVEWYVGEGFHGIFINGTSGEWFSQSEAERRLVAETAVKAAAGRIPIVVGVTSFTAQGAAELARHAMETGAAGVASTAPPYAKTLPDETVAFYSELGERSEAPLMVYNWPHGTSIDIGPDLADRIADLEYVVALKDSTPDGAQFQATTRRVVDRVRIFGNFMNNAGMDFLLEHGGDGMIGGGSLFGRPDAEFWNNIWAGRLDEARVHAEASEKLFDALWAPGGWRGHFGAYQSQLKAAMDMRGIPGGGPVRPPRLPVTDPQSLQRIRSIMRDAGMVVLP